ncbi:MAG: CRISPR-associated endonuclease Cas1 [Bacteroidetes bacterium]|nr:CRISPR-associated endonuclease Cas1 [Bacteroidota bacterium]
MDPIEDIFNLSQIKRAWEIVRSKNKSGGADNVHIPEFENDSENNLIILHKSILSREFNPEAYKTIFIPKENSGNRKITLPAIQDKIVQICILLYYQPFFEKSFSKNSYAYRLNKNHANSINRINDYVKSGSRWFLTCDIDNYFDTIDRSILMEKVSKNLNCRYVCELIEIWIRMGNIYKDNYQESNKGIPQGSVLSPMLSNLYLDDLDKEMERNKFKYIRYSDNIFMADYTRDGLEEKSKSLIHNLSGLNLKLNTEETEISHKEKGFTFCGIYFIKGKRIISPDRLEKKKAKISEVISKNNLQDVSGKINDYFRGINKYFRNFDTKDQFVILEEHFKNELVKKVIRLSENNLKFNYRSELKIIYSIEFLIEKTNADKEFIYKKLVSLVSEKRKSYSVNKSDSRFVNRKIGVKRKKYYKIFYSNIDLMVTSPGTQLGKSGDNIVIKTSGNSKKEISSDKVKNIIISSPGVTVSTDLLKLCSEKEIRLDLLDNIGKPVCSFITPTSDFYFICSEQSNLKNTTRNSIISRDIIGAKIKNQLNLLKYFTKNKDDADATVKFINEETVKIVNSIKEIEGSDIKKEFSILRDEFLGYEGIAAAAYWNCVNALLPEEYNFEKREHKGSKDLVNMLFNYAYGILYTKILAAVTIAGLNPNTGFFHSKQKGKPVLIYDIIEQFRAPFADRAVISLLTKGSKVCKENDLLTKETRNILAKKVLSRLNTEVIYKNRRMNNNSVILEKVRELVSYIKGESRIYKPYIMKW